MTAHPMLPMETRSMTDSTSSWARRFIWTAIIQGAIIVGLTVVLVVGQASFLKPEISRVIASGGAGTWFTFGYLIYISVGVIAVAVSAVFYHLALEMDRKSSDPWHGLI